ncbi:MAG: type IX secretion system sortase PorU [Muribaculaceae bacterium]|nr:type IX secretion system sortase PorU [Muribaculaceae bacterium]
MTGKNSKSSISKYLFAAVCAICTLSASALPASYYAESSRLAKSGLWVKVKVTETGVQAIDHETLSAWGFSDPSKVRVYGFSGVDLAPNIFSETQPDDLPEVYSESIDGRLFFYGEGDVRVNVDKTLDFTYQRNYYSTYSCYFLSDADIEKRDFDTVSFKENEQTPRTTHISSILYEPEQENISESGVYFFSKRLSQYPEVGKKAFVLTDYAQGEKAVISYACAAKYQQPSGGSVTLKIEPKFSDNISISSKNIKSIQTVTASNSSLQFYSQLPANSLITFTLIEGKGNTLDVTFADPNIEGCSYFALDFACVNYTRKNRLGDNGQVSLIYPSSVLENVNISEAGSGTRVWDITEPGNVRIMQTSAIDDNTLAFSPDRNTAVRYIVFNPSAGNFIKPEFVETVQSVNLHADKTAYEMVIITTQELLNDAKQLADLHRNLQNMDVKVVLHTDLYNEFSSGAPSAIAYRRYLKMLYDRNPGTLKYALLFGHGTYDNRHITIEDDEYLQTYQVEEDRFSTNKRFYRWVPQSYTCDNYFGMLNDSFTLSGIVRTQADIAVSRIPVNSSADAQVVINNILSYLADVNKGYYQSQAIIMSDSGDDNAHLLMAEEAANIILKNRPSTIVTKVYNTLLPESTNLSQLRAKQAIAQGAGYIGYSGHGDYTFIASPPILTRTDIRELPYGNNSIFFLATCHGIVMDQAASSLGMDMFKTPKGPVFVGGSGRQVYLESNPLIYNGFTEALYSAEESDLTGDVWRKGFNKAQAKAYGNDDDGVNNLNYLVIGDPALPLGFYSLGVNLTSINSISVTGEPISVTALEPIEIKGKIVDSNGNPVSDFNGSVSITLLDGETSQPYTETAKVELDGSLLAMTGAKVRNGEFTATLVAPMGATANSINRLIITAYNYDKTQTAIGSYEKLTVMDNPDQPEDVNGPEITEMYLEDPNFLNGDAVGASPTFYATIAADPAGIAIANGILGAKPRLTLDGQTSLKDASSTVRFAEDGTATLSADLFNLTDGYHYLTLDVCDNVGNHTSRKIEFIVINEDLTATLSCDTEVIRDKAVLTLNAPQSANPYRLVIEDAAGNAVDTSIMPSFPYTWKPSSSLPDGLYRAFATLRTETRFAKTPLIELKLIKK